MRAPLFIESLSRTPSSAWAARPLASGVRSSLIGRRGCFSVGLGCPSFGGQRTDSGGASRLPAKLVTGQNRQLPAEREEVLSVAIRIQTAGLAAEANVGVPFWRSLPRRGRRAEPTWKDTSSQARPNRIQVHEVSTRRRHAIWQPGCFPAPLAASRSCCLLAQCGSPNHSVKGTSRKRAAPYVER